LTRGMLGPRTLDRLALLFAILVVVGSAIISATVYEGIPHIEDEFANLWQAQVMARGEISIPSPELPESFLVPFVVDHAGQRFGKYSPGWPAALSLAIRIGAPWLVNALLTGLTIWLIYRLGSKIAGRGAGLLAAVLAGSSPMTLMLSGSLMSHMLSLFLTMVFSVAWLDLFIYRATISAPRWMLVAAAGLSLGLLILTRPLTALGVALPFAIHGVILLIRGPKETRWRVLAIGGLTLGVGALLLVWQAALTGDPLQNPYALWWDYDRLGFGPGIGVTENGHSLYLAWINTRFSLSAGQHDLFGWPFLSWIFIPFGLIALRRNRAAWLLFSITPSLIGIYIFYWIGSWLYGPRYYFEALPGLAFVSAAGVAWIGGWLTKMPRLARLRRVAISVLIVVLLGLNVLYYLPARVGGMRGLYGISKAPIVALQDQDFEGALILVHVDRWHRYATLRLLSPPFSSEDILVAWSFNPVRDAMVQEAYAGRTIYHYYPSAPESLFREARTQP
jgi:4-amino-4-deoxy-L-arabinose transferase-like glycosyltransferase